MLKEKLNNKAIKFESVEELSECLVQLKLEGIVYYPTQIKQMRNAVEKDYTISFICGMPLERDNVLDFIDGKTHNSFSVYKALTHYTKWKVIDSEFLTPNMIDLLQWYYEETDNELISIKCGAFGDVTYHFDVIDDEPVIYTMDELLDECESYVLHELRESIVYYRDVDMIDKFSKIAKLIVEVRKELE